jgi:hypothetical protein
MTPSGGIVSGGSVEPPLPEKDCPVDEGATVVVCVTVRGDRCRHRRELGHVHRHAAAGRPRADDRLLLANLRHAGNGRYDHRRALCGSDGGQVQRRRGRLQRRFGDGDPDRGTRRLDHRKDRGHLAGGHRDQRVSVRRRHGGSGGSGPATPPTASLALDVVGSGRLHGVPHGRTETVAGRFSSNQAAQLAVSVARLGRTQKIALLKGARVAGTTLVRKKLTIKADLRHAGGYSFRLILPRQRLVRGKTYVIRINGRAGTSTGRTLALRFRA